jgi:tripartite-type tricarboxylate transporter receptor subunit TctC
MELQRRRFLRLAAGAASLPAISRIAAAQSSYPSRPVRLLVGYPAGGAADLLARLWGQRLSERLGQPFVVDNRPGAASNIATEAVVRAPADGHTLLVIGAFNAINATLYDKLNFNFIRDIAPVAGMLRAPLVMTVNSAFPARTVPEFIAYAKANPGKVNFASGGSGGPIHVAGELFKMLADIDMVHVPYRGETPAFTDLLGGQVQAMFPTVPASIQHIRTGKLRALAVTSATRAATLPDIPTVAEFVAGYEASAWFGIGTPSNTPAGIIETLNREINAGFNDPAMKARMIELGGAPLTGSSADLRKLITEETEKWAKVVRFSGARPS